MSKFVYFGEKVKGYDVRVLNEREARAGAGILLLFATIAFFNAFLKGNYYPIKIFVTAFLIEFAIRVFINPKYAPSLILGRFFIRNQDVEYTGAPQKKFAWALGLTLAITMFILVVIFNVKGPLNLLICLFCLTLLFFESVFGICIGCMMYNWFMKDKAKHCPGGACEIKFKEKIQKISPVQIIVVVLFILLIVAIPVFGLIQSEPSRYSGPDNESASSQTPEECEVPEWAKAIGHEDQYRLHHGCI